MNAFSFKAPLWLCSLLLGCVNFIIVPFTIAETESNFFESSKNSYEEPVNGMWPVHTSNEWQEENEIADNYFDYTNRLKNDLMNKANALNEQTSAQSATGGSLPISNALDNDSSLFPPSDRPIESIIPPLPPVPIRETKSASVSSENNPSQSVEKSSQAQTPAAPPSITESHVNSKKTPAPQSGDKTAHATLQNTAKNHTDNSLNEEDAKFNGSKAVSVDFNNVAMVEYIHFISRLSGKNFIFDDSDLQFNVTIVSEEPTSVENLMAALLQELKIRDLSLMEQGNNLIIHRNPRVRSPARVVNDGVGSITTKDSELVTRVFRLNTLDPVKAGAIIRPLLSDDAVVEVLQDSNNIIITDLVVTVNRIADLIGTLDAPNSGMSIGQYHVRNGYADSLVEIGTKILLPIAQGNPFVLVPHNLSNSIFIVSNSFIVEKAMAILQNLDYNEGKTKIFSLETLQPSYFQENREGRAAPSSRIEGGVGGIGEFTPQEIERLRAAGFDVDAFLNRLTPEERMRLQATHINLEGRLGSLYSKFSPDELARLKASGINVEGKIGNLYERTSDFGGSRLDTGGAFGSVYKESGIGNENIPGGRLGVEGRQSAIFSSDTPLTPGGIGSSSRYLRELPVGHIERTMFFIYKLKYRKGDGIQIALQKIATSLATSGTANADLIAAINSSQWIEASNALIFTGMPAALERVRELILEIDIPLRQVFIEMLILDTTINDSLTYSVDWINRFGGGTTTGEEGFNTLASTTSTNFVTTAEAIDTVQGTFPSTIPNTNTLASPLPVASGFLGLGGFAAGVIGTHLTHNGTCFSSIGALVKAIHSDSKANILLNPKIITEDNNPAEIFVGGVDRYKTQSISNDLGNVITNNFQFIDVGTMLRVTPLIGNNGIITLEIVQESTSAVPGANAPGLAADQDVNLVAVLSKTRSVTKIHVPNGFFVIFSGMITDNETRTYSRIPCLGGIPLIGGFGKSQSNSDAKRNLMLFIRPLIVDTDEDYEEVTRRQQEVYREKCKFRRSWNYEIDEGMNFLNIKPTDPDEIGCGLGR